MADTKKLPIVLIYNEFNIGKYASVKHYETKNVLKPFTNQINIAKDRGFAKSNPNYWLKTKEGVKWSKNALSGLFKTKVENLYYADVKSKGKKTNTFLVEFCNNTEILKVYFFDYYTKDISSLVSLIK